MSQNEPKQRNATQNQQQRFMVNSLTCPHPGRFDNPFINRRGFIYMVISKMSLTFQVSTRVQGSVSIRAAGKANI